MPKGMELCNVAITSVDMITRETKMEMFVIQPDSLGIVLECLQGLNKLGRAMRIPGGKILEDELKVEGKEDDSADPKTT